MKAVIISIIIFVISVAFSPEGNVIICLSPKAYAYHNSYCKGLTKCSYATKTIPESEAIKKGYKPCKLCYGE